MSIPAPDPSVLAAFGLTGRPELLTGGQGQSYRCDGVVLKPADDVAQVGWCSDLLAELPARGFRLARPVRARDGQWLAEDWTAATEVAGKVGPAGRWTELIGAGARFHAALSKQPRPAQLARRTDRWAEADRVAWGEQPADPLPVVAPLLDRIWPRWRPVHLPSQLIHGDLAGNVLFADDDVPAIIDFSPYWRPLDYATALIVVDGLLWWDAGSELLALAPAGPDFGQLLLRALIFRLLALDGRARQVDPAALDELDAFAAVADRLPTE